MIKEHYKLIIPVKPDSINQVCTYGKKGGDILKLKHKWEKIAIGYIKRARVEMVLPEEFHGKIGVHFKLFFEQRRERDGDNYTLMCKGILDAFVKDGMIIDDNHKYVDDNGRRMKIDKDRPRVEVHITEKVDDNKFVSISDYASSKTQSHSKNKSEQCRADGNIRIQGSIGNLADQISEAVDAPKSLEATTTSNNG